MKHFDCDKALAGYEVVTGKGWRVSELRKIIFDGKELLAAIIKDPKGFGEYEYVFNMNGSLYHPVSILNEELNLYMGDEIVNIKIAFNKSGFPYITEDVGYVDTHGNVIHYVQVKL